MDDLGNNQSILATATDGWMVSAPFATRGAFWGPTAKGKNLYGAVLKQAAVSGFINMARHQVGYRNDKIQSNIIFQNGIYIKI